MSHNLIPLYTTSITVSEGLESSGSTLKSLYVAEQNLAFPKVKKIELIFYLIH